LELISLMAAGRQALGNTERERVAAMAREKAFPGWLNEGTFYLWIDLDGRHQAVGVREQEQVVEVISLADATFEPGRSLDVLRANAAPGVAGLAILRQEGQHPLLVARSANFVATLDDSELLRMLVGTARRADTWERENYEEDRW